jgi:hypothetical protein
MRAWNWISEGMMKRSLAISAVLLALSGCGKVATQNPFLPNVAPTPAASYCPSRFNFEGASGLSGWTQASWAPGFSGAISLDGQHTWCGSQAMAAQFSIAGGNQGVIYYVFSQGQDLSGRNVSVNLYLDTPPPSDLGFVIYFMDRKGIWIEPLTASHFGMHAGWNPVVENFGVNYNNATVGDVVELILQFFDNNSGASYAGKVWIDEINW